MEEKKYTYKYPHPSVTADCVVFAYHEDKLHVLLIQRARDPYKGRWAFPGGFVEMDETCEEGAVRELKEETGLSVDSMKQFHIYSDPQRDPRERVISVACLAMVDYQEVRGDDDAAQATWFPLDNIPPLAFDHDIILRDALKQIS